MEGVRRIGRGGERNASDGRRMVWVVDGVDDDFRF